MVRLPSFREATGRRPLRILIVEDSENYALLLLLRCAKVSRTKE